MKKVLSLLVALVLTATLSCGGSSSGGGGGGGGTGDHYTQAQKVMAGALYAALLAQGAASSGALGDAIAQFEDSGTTAGSLNFETTYAAVFEGEGSTDQATIIGIDQYTLTGAPETGGTLTISSADPLNHTSTITSVTVPADGTYAAIEIGSAGGDEITGTLSGSATIDSSGEVTAVSVTGSDYDGTDVNVTLTGTDGSGTATFADWAPTSAMSGTTLNTTLTGVAGTVVHSSGETYSCTLATATLAVPTSSESETGITFTVDTVPNCDCTAGCS